MKAKREEFWSMLECTEPDIIIASETWLKPDIKEKEVLPDSYHFVARKDRPGSAHGGTAIIARSNIDAVEIDTNTTTEFVAASFACKDLQKPLIIGSLYRPTNNNQEYTDNLCKAISNLYSNFKNHIIWIGGDANLPDIDWQTDSIQGHNYPVGINKSYINLINDIGCQQIVDFPTRSSNTLDIFLTT